MAFVVHRSQGCRDFAFVAGCTGSVALISRNFGDRMLFINASANLILQERTKG